jgi:hypothetical protein
MSPRTFSGRECWVYRAQAPSELCGHHTELIEQALGGTEADCLLYSPLRETGRGPFELEGPSGSHAVALTRTSLIVSRDPHRSGMRRTVRRIPLTNVLTLALGEALTLGWLTVQFVENRALAAETVFFQSSGIEHFRDLVRRWLRNESRRPSLAQCGDDRDELLATSPAYLANQVRPLIADIGAVEAVNVPEVWEGAGDRSRCGSASTLLVLAESVVMLAERERPPRPGMLVFGVNVICFPRRAITQIGLRLPDDPEHTVVAVAFTLTAAGISHRVSRDLAISTDVASHVVARLGTQRLRADGAA